LQYFSTGEQKYLSDQSSNKVCVTHDFLFARQITGSDALWQPLKALGFSEW
jgi:hypothetical protein